MKFEIEYINQGFKLFHRAIWRVLINFSNSVNNYCLNAICGINVIAICHVTNHNSCFHLFLQRSNVEHKFTFAYTQTRFKHVTECTNWVQRQMWVCPLREMDLFSSIANDINYYYVWVELLSFTSESNDNHNYQQINFIPEILFGRTTNRPLFLKD